MINGRPMGISGMINGKCIDIPEVGGKSPLSASSMQNIKSAISSLKSRVLFNRFAAYHRAEIFDAEEMKRGNLVRVEPAITQIVTHGKNFLAVNMSGVKLDPDGHIQDIDAELKGSVAILNTENCFRNMVYIKKNYRFDFIFDPQSRLFVFSQDEKNPITLAQGFRIMKELKVSKIDIPPIMFKGQIKTSTKGDIFDISTTLFTTIDVETIGAGYIKWAYSNLASGLTGIGCSRWAEVHDMEPERSEVAWHLGKMDVKTLSDVTRIFG